MTYCAVVKYPVDAPDAEKIKILFDGLSACAMELVELGVDLEDIENGLELAGDAAIEEKDAIQWFKDQQA